VQLRGNTLPPDPMPKPPSVLLYIRAARCEVRAVDCTVLQVEDASYMGPRIDKIMTAVHDATRDKIKLQQVRAPLQRSQPET
jgi:hypothetical protein